MSRINNRNKYLDNVIKNRFILFGFFIVLIFILIFIKLYSVMIFNNKEYLDIIKDTSYVTVSGDSSPRGRIFDRNGVLLVDNIAVKSIVYSKPKKISNKELINTSYLVSSHIDLDISRLSDYDKRKFYLDKNPSIGDSLVTIGEINKYKSGKISRDDFYDIKINRIDKKIIDSFSDEDNKAAYLYYLMNRGYSYDEKVIKKNCSEEEYAYISEHNEEFIGFNTSLDWERYYPNGDTLKNILGRVGSISSENKEYYLNKGYALNDRVGVSYIEKQYEDYLKGDKPIYQVVNSSETKLVKEGSRGNDIVLTIDIELQKMIDEVLTNYVMSTKGEANTEYYDHSSVIIQDPYTGEILAISSKKYVDGEIVDNTSSILTSPITPGSIVKGASMLVGYNTGAIKIGEYMLDECVKVAGAPEKCSSVDNLGTINDITALAKSSNVYQFKTAIRVNGQEYHKNMKLIFKQETFDKYRKMYRSFGLGTSTGIDLPVESFGYTSKDKSAGNLLDYVMGQYETYTPLQISQYISTIANGGSRYQMHLLKEVHKATNTNELGEIMYTYPVKVLNNIETDPVYLDRVREGFYAVMNSSGGYGVGYIDSSLHPAGKTGTSQSFIDTDNDGKIDTETITSSFIGYFPAENPRISIVVTSPDSSHPNSSIDYASLVTYRITREITNRYSYMY